MVTEQERLEHARNLRRDPTEPEIRVWRCLSRSQSGYKFRRQHVIDRYICDFFCPAKGLIVEIDGDTHDAVRDANRDKALLQRGFATVRFSNAEVMRNLDGVSAVIANALANLPDRWSGPHPNLSPEGEGLLP